jgi:hypothetical protein
MSIDDQRPARSKTISRALRWLSRVLYVVSGVFLMVSAWYLFYHTEKLVGTYQFFAIALLFGIVGWITDDLAS